METISWTDMLQALSPELESRADQMSSSVLDFFGGKKQYLIFLSATDGQQRARVVRGKATTFKESWKMAVQRLRKALLLKKMKPVWVKADLVTDIATVPFVHLMQEIGRHGNLNYRRGISFDWSFKHAFLEQEINANRFFPQEEGQLHVNVDHIDQYAKNVRNLPFRIQPEKLKNVYTFDTVSVTHDGFQIHEQETGPLYHGTRSIESMDATSVFGVVHGASQFLANQVLQSGEFVYGYFPVFHQGLDTYSMLHHASSAYALAEAYTVTKNENLLGALENALDFLTDQMVDLHLDGQDCTFVIAKERDDAITLGANAYAVIALAKYTEITGSDVYQPLLRKLAQGILYHQKEDGSFAHILNPDGSVEKSFATVSFDTEAAFALVRMYDIDPQEAWLSAAKQSMDYFVEQDYARYGNPWLSYATEALFRHDPKRAYAELNLRNMDKVLNYCLTLESAAPELLELLMASYRLMINMKENDQHQDLLETIDTKKMGRVMQARARHQLDSFFWPEMAMYFQVPMHIAVGFYDRENSFLTSISEMANQLVSFSHYYQAVEQETTKKEVGILPDDRFRAWEETETLMITRRLEKREKWQEAVDVFEPFMDDHTNCLDITYANFANDLRKASYTDRARNVLQEGKEFYPHSEFVLAEEFNLYRQLGDVATTESVAKTLVETEPEQAEHYFMLGKANADLKRKDKAKEAFQTGLTYWHGMPFAKLLKKIQRGFTDEPEKVKSTFKYIDGGNNLGMIEHEVGDRVYFTKISELASQTERERIFYEELQQQYPTLKAVAPALIDVQVIDNIQYLTTMKVDSMKTTKHLEEVFQVSEQITSIPYQEIVKEYPNPRYPFVLKNRGATVVKFFTEIHRKEHNERLFASLRGFASANGYPEKAHSLIERLEKMVMDSALYESLKPEKHYSLLHGDFTKSNMMAKQTDESVQVIDWGAFTIGPRFMDIALFLNNLRTSYDSVQRNYLFPENGEPYLDDVEQVFFLYGFIVLYFIKLMNRGVDYDEDVTAFIEPALQDMEHLLEVKDPVHG